MVHFTKNVPESSSSSSTRIGHNYVYDVFISFRGADTRNSFTDHLHKALLEASITTFLDDEKIYTGEPLKPKLQSAIKSSRASIIVLSENYASSTWCLDELVSILDQMRIFSQIVIPIFYHVEPTHVRKQHGSFGEAMAIHMQRMEEETDAEKRSQLAQKIESWKIALKQVADLKGKDVQGRKETDFIEEVVSEIRLRVGVLLDDNTPQCLVGMDDHVKFISSWLTDGSCHTAGILTVVGMSGIGKTSLAKYVFGLHSSKFYRSIFIDDINTKFTSQLPDLQKQLSNAIPEPSSIQVHDDFVHTSKTENVNSHKKVLLALDDVGSLEQVNVLLGNKVLHPGSKIMITTKDASLTGCDFFNSKVQPEHSTVSLNGLNQFASLELLCIHAFHSQNPKEGYEEVSENLVKYCNGHPLALKTLGVSLQKQDVAQWEECIKVLKKEPNSHINMALKMSFDALPYDNDKKLFKHIACFFVGTDRDVTESILNACDMNTRFGITNLINRCLLSIGWDYKLKMHQLVQEMARDLVRQESLEKPWKRSRLWCHEESFKVLKQKTGKGNIQGLALDMRMLDKKDLHGSFELEIESLSKMFNLKLLQLNYVQLNGSFEKFPQQLRWLCMHGFALKSIPSDIPMKNLVALDMSYSNIESFDMSYSNSQPPAKRQKQLDGSCSIDKRLLGSLKILNLSFCEQLHSLGGFYELPALEQLIVRVCISLIEVCESVEQCVELFYIDFSYCYKLKKVPISIQNLENVETMMLNGLSSRESQIEAISDFMKHITVSLPSSLTNLYLKNNNLYNESFPMDFSSLSMLNMLTLEGNPIVSMPSCVRTLPRLKMLFLVECKMLISVENPPRTLEFLAINSFEDSYRSSLRKIKFVPEMFPLELSGMGKKFTLSSSEIDGVIKIQAFSDVEEKVLHSLGWANLEFISERSLEIAFDMGEEPHECQTQMCYEFGIFSTLYEGREIPDWISHRFVGQSTSFKIPAHPYKVRGLNFFCVAMSSSYTFYVPKFKISNVTENNTWIYDPCIEGVILDGEYCSMLSHWMFGPNEMKAGDHITIAISYLRDDKYALFDCGFSLVYDDGDTEEEDVLGYYKSWNHIIGGDLSGFQSTTGEYILSNYEFSRYSLEPPELPETLRYYSPFTSGKAYFKENSMWFKAFSGKKTQIVGEIDLNKQPLF